MSKKVEIELARIVRQTKKVVVQVPDDFDSWASGRREALMSRIYNELDEGYDYKLDEDWGPDEGTHCYNDTTKKITGKVEYLVTSYDGPYPDAVTKVKS